MLSFCLTTAGISIGARNNPSPSLLSPCYNTQRKYEDGIQVFAGDLHGRSGDAAFHQAGFLPEDHAALPAVAP
jgi:hypothetical protein